MIDSVVGIKPEKRIQAIKNVTGNEMQFLGHFPDRAIMPGTFIVEAIGQAASILFSKMTGAELKTGEYVVLGTINNMRFLVPVVPGDRMETDVKVLKVVQDLALVEGAVTVDGRLVATGTLGFARRSL
jgi:3-hydroxyacyl-[acyl-carrier-protein] dehydratase